MKRIRIIQRIYFTYKTLQYIFCSLRSVLKRFLSSYHYKRLLNIVEYNKLIKLLNSLEMTIDRRWQHTTVRLVYWEHFCSLTFCNCSPFFNNPSWCLSINMLYSDGMLVIFLFIKYFIVIFRDGTSKTAWADVVRSIGICTTEPHPRWTHTFCHVQSIRCRTLIVFLHK